MIQQLTTFAGFVCHDQAGTTKRNIMVLIYGLLIVLLVHMFLRAMIKQKTWLITTVTILSSLIAFAICGAMIFLGTEWGCTIF